MRTSSRHLPPIAIRTWTPFRGVTTGAYVGLKPEIGGMGDHGRPRSIGALLGTVEDLLDTAPRDAKVSSDRRVSRSRRLHVHHRLIPIGERSRERQARERILGPEAPFRQCLIQVRHALGAHIDHSEKVLLGEGAGLTDRRDPGTAQGGQGAGSETKILSEFSRGFPLALLPDALLFIRLARRYPAGFVISVPSNRPMSRR